MIILLAEAKRLTEVTKVKNLERQAKKDGGIPYLRGQEKTKQLGKEWWRQK